MAARTLYPWNSDDINTDITPEDVGFHPVPDADYFEANTYVVFLENGGYIFCQVVISNVGMWTNSPGIGVKILDPDGTAHEWTDSYYASAINIPEEGSLILQDKECLYADDGESRTYTLKIPKTGANTYGDLELVFTAEGKGFVLGDGKAAYDEERTKYSKIVLAMPRARVTGRLTLNGEEQVLEGIGFASHVIMTIKAHRISSGYELLKFYNDTMALGCTQLVSPADTNHERSSLAFFHKDGELVAVVTDVEVETHDVALDADTKYPVAGSVSFHMRGTTLDGKDFAVDVDVPQAPETLIEKFDVLLSIPWALRVIIKAFIASPWQYRWRSPVVAHITIGDETFDMEGEALRERIYINPEG